MRMRSHCGASGLNNCVCVTIVKGVIYIYGIYGPYGCYHVISQLMDTLYMEVKIPWFNARVISQLMLINYNIL